MSALMFSLMVAALGIPLYLLAAWARRHQAGLELRPEEGEP
jgi:hypothetical protein